MSKPTADQVRQVLNLMEEKKTTREHFTALLRRGLLADLLDPKFNPEEVSRSDFRQAVRFFLLTRLTEVLVERTEKFEATKAFGPENPAGIRFHLLPIFQEYLPGMTEEKVPARNVTIHRLERPSLNSAIRAELGEGHTISLVHLYELIKAQAHGEEGPLLTNGWGNIAYIRDYEGAIWAVDSGWVSSRRGWCVAARSVESPDAWCAGYQVLS